jgi:hypothetical protein
MDHSEDAKEEVSSGGIASVGKFKEDLLLAIKSNANT